MRFLLVLCGVLVLGAAGCGDSKPPATPPDKGVDGADLPWQQDLPQPDTRSPDKFVWPDVKPPSDTTPWPKPDGYYAGAPFGCQADSDCFGQKCCATPWGVKLCAPTCDLK